jgi:hypothetical protein
LASFWSDKEGVIKIYPLIGRPFHNAGRQHRSAQKFANCRNIGQLNNAWLFASTTLGWDIRLPCMTAMVVNQSWGEEIRCALEASPPGIAMHGSGAGALPDPIMALRMHDMAPMRTPAFTPMFLTLLIIFISSPTFSRQPPNRPELWQDRGDVSALDLLNGTGQASLPPGAQFQFLKESLNGTSPKFEVKDENGIKWKVKLGEEVKSETAAACLVSAAGYFVDEDYYRSEIHVEGLQRLSRGQEYVRHGDTVESVRLERHRSGPDPAVWSWFENPFTGTKEFNGLRVLMALINNWDLKDINNAIYIESSGSTYVVADLGATFGRTGSALKRSKGNVKDYTNSAFILKVTSDHVDFQLASRPIFIQSLTNSQYYHERTEMEKVVKNIPINDARWIGNQLGRFSQSQVADCFRSAGFSRSEVNSYAEVVTKRIAALKGL